MTIYRFAQFLYNTDNRELISSQQSIRLRRKVADVLTYLLTHQETVISKDEFLKDIWLHSEFRENSLVHCIRELRKHLEDSAQHPIFIDTVPQKGYCWIYRDVTQVQNNEPLKTAERAAASELFKPSQTAEIMISSIPSLREATPEEKPLSDTPPPAVQQKSSFIDTWFQVFTVACNQKLGLLLGLMLISCLIWIWPLLQNEKAPTESVIKSTETVDKTLTIAVMPFFNATGLAEYQWLELGLSDMFGVGLRQRTNWQVIPSSNVQSMLAELDISLWTSKPGESRVYPRLDIVQQQVQTFLNASKVDLVISASIEQDNKSPDGQKLKFNYQLHDKLGIRHKGSISYSNLPSSVPTLISRITSKLDPVFKSSSNHWHLAKDPQASQDFANGLQALQGKGAPLAKRYFEAALLNDPDYYPAAAYLAYSLSLLGEWQKSVEHYRQVLLHTAINQDPYFHSFVLNSLGDLLRQQHKLAEAEKLLTQAMALTEQQQLRYRKVAILRNLSELKNAQGKNKERHRLLAEAEQLSQPFVDINMLADNLYYLGSPSNTGLEIDPDINMAANQQQLNRALSYYKKINNLHGQAKTYLAMGANYLYDFDTRHEALIQARLLFERLDDNSELINTLSYLGYFYIQLHMGEKAEPFLLEAQKLAFELQDKWRQANILYLLAFATLDQGLTPSTNNAEYHLERAIELFDQVHLAYHSFPIAQNTADAYLLQAWGFTELKRYDEAKSALNESMKRLDTVNNPVTLLYNEMALMDVLLRQHDWAGVLAVTKDTQGHYQLFNYLARAHFELGHTEKAIALMQKNAKINGVKWSDVDQQKLDYYLASASSDSSTMVNMILGTEARANKIYCESLWNQSVVQLDSLAAYEEL